MQLISDKTLRDIETSLGLDLADEKQRSEVMTEIIELVSNRAGLRIIKEFTEKDAEEFNLIPEGNLEEMENYILSKKPDAREIFEEEAQKAKEEILNTRLDAIK